MSYEVKKTKLMLHAMHRIAEGDTTDPAKTLAYYTNGLFAGMTSTKLLLELEAKFVVFDYCTPSLAGSINDIGLSEIGKRDVDEAIGHAKAALIKSNDLDATIRIKYIVADATSAWIQVYESGTREKVHSEMSQDTWYSLFLGSVTLLCNIVRSYTPGLGSATAYLRDLPGKFIAAAADIIMETNTTLDPANVLKFSWLLDARARMQVCAELVEMTANVLIGMGNDQVGLYKEMYQNLLADSGTQSIATRMLSLFLFSRVEWFGKNLPIRRGTLGAYLLSERSKATDVTDLQPMPEAGRVSLVLECVPDITPFVNELDLVRA